VQKAEPTIFKRKNEAGEIVGWTADIKLPGHDRRVNVREHGIPTNFYGSIYPSKNEAIEAAKRKIIWRS
jgi:hypothetical protein